MTNRMNKNELTRRLAQRMKSDEATAAAWIDGVVETLYESFKAGESVTLPGFGSFYVRPEPQSWVFKERYSGDSALAAGYCQLIGRNEVHC